MLFEHAIAAGWFALNADYVTISFKVTDVKNITA